MITQDSGNVAPVRPIGGQERVVIVHDYLTQKGGAERVVLAMLRVFPRAKLVTSVYEPEQTFPEFRRFDVDTTWLNSIRIFRRNPRLALPFLGLAFSRLVIRDADVVICSSSGWAHRVKTDGRKIVYCHNPPRWLYQQELCFPALHRIAGKVSFLASKSLRDRDRKFARTADIYLVNGSPVRERVEAAYGIDAEILHPPPGIDAAGPTEAISGVTPGFFLTVGRARGYKQTQSVANAFRDLPTEELVVVGDRTVDESTNVTVFHGIRDGQLRWLYENAKALIAVSDEDFGLTPIESGLFGTPVIALRAGGYLDTIEEGKTGLFIDDRLSITLASAVLEVQERAWNRNTIARSAQRFGAERFASRLKELVAGSIAHN